VDTAARLTELGSGDRVEIDGRWAEKSIIHNEDKTKSVTVFTCKSIRCGFFQMTDKDTQVIADWLDDGGDGVPY